MAAGPETHGIDRLATVRRWSPRAESFQFTAKDARLLRICTERAGARPRTTGDAGSGLAFAPSARLGPTEATGRASGPALPVQPAHARCRVAGPAVPGSRCHAPRAKLPCQAPAPGSRKRAAAMLLSLRGADCSAARCGWREAISTLDPRCRGSCSTGICRWLLRRRRNSPLRMVTA